MILHESWKRIKIIKCSWQSRALNNSIWSFELNWTMIFGNWIDLNWIAWSKIEPPPLPDICISQYLIASIIIFPFKSFRLSVICKVFDWWKYSLDIYLDNIITMCPSLQPSFILAIFSTFTLTHSLLPCFVGIVIWGNSSKGWGTFSRSSCSNSAPAHLKLIFVLDP
jgi:hypothetical protein